MGTDPDSCVHCIGLVLVRALLASETKPTAFGEAHMRAAAACCCEGRFCEIDGGRGRIKRAFVAVAVPNCTGGLFNCRVTSPE